MNASNLRAIARLLPMLLLAAVASGCDRSQWQEQSIRDGGFRVLMRPQPHYEKRQLDTPVGAITAHLYTMELSDSVFGVGYSDYPEQMLRMMAPRRMFMDVRDGWMKRIDGRLQGEGKDIRLEGTYPGMEIVASGTVNGREAYLRGRFYLVGNRLYQIVVFGNRDSIPLADVNRFLSSFKLIPPREVSDVTIQPAPDKKQ
jgi:hypothetical protein